MHPEIFIQSRESKVFEDPEYQVFSEDLINNEFNKPIYGLRRPDYLASSKIALRIKRHLQDPKFIVVLRNPLDRAISSYYHYMRYGIIPVKNPNHIWKILNGEFDRNIKAYENILDYGLYYKHLNNYFEIFERDRFLILLQEEVLNENPSLLWEKLSQFLEIKYKCIERPVIKPQASIYNLNRLRILSIQNKFKYQYDSDRRKSYSNAKENISFWGHLVCNTISIADNYLFKKIFFKSDLIPEKLRKNILSYYLDDINKLEVLLCRNLTNWKNLQ